MTIANILSALRLVLAPLLLWLAWRGRGEDFLLLLGVAFFLDFIDGSVARALHQVSSLGGHLDSIADFAIYSCYLLGAWWLWPGIVRQQAPWVLLVAASILVPEAVSLIRFRRLSSYHTWLVKAAVFCTAISSMLLFLHGPVWPFHLAVGLCLLAAIEQLAITLVLRRPASDLKSLWHVLRRIERSREGEPLDSGGKHHER